MSKRWLVVGGGLRGIVGAYLLARSNNEVVLIDGVNHRSDLGGALSSALWNGFYLDKGCHLLANTDDKITPVIMDLLGQENVHPVSVRYASIINGKTMDGAAIPDLSAYGEEASRDILYQLLGVVSEPAAPSEENLQERFNNRYGLRAGQYLAAAFRKKYQADATDIAPEALSMTPFRRIRFLNDSAADILKENPTLDERVASSSQSDPMRFWRHQAREFEYREFYPKQRGMRGFCENAVARLEDLGVSFQLGQPLQQVHLHPDGVSVLMPDGQQVDGEQLLWTTGIEAVGPAMGFGNGISDYVHTVPSVLYYFAIEKGTEGPYTYVQDFDLEDLVFRASVPGTYGLNNCPEGMSYVCCEVSTHLASAEWESPEEHATRAWMELQKYGVVRCEEPIDTLTVKVPSTYKMPKVGYQAGAEEIFQFLRDESRVTLAEQWDFSMNDIIRSMQKLIEQVQSGHETVLR